MFKEDAFQVRAVVDKRGRKVKGSKKNEDMRRYYRLKGEEEAAEAARLQRQAAGDASEEEEEEHEQPAAAAAARGAKPRPAKGKQQQQRELAPPSSDEEDEEDVSEPGSSSDDDLDPEERAAQERWARMRCAAGFAGEGIGCVYCSCCCADPELLLHDPDLHKKGSCQEEVALVCFCVGCCLPVCGLVAEHTAVNKPARRPGPAQAGATYGRSVTSCCEQRCLPLVWLAATLNPWAAGPVLRANISSSCNQSIALPLQWLPLPSAATTAFPATPCRCCD